MKKNRNIAILSRAALLAMSVPLPLAAAAQNMPKQFDFSVSYHAVVSNSSVALGGKDFVSSFHGHFIATNDAGDVFMNNMFGKCSYVVMRAGGILQMTEY